MQLKDSWKREEIKIILEVPTEKFFRSGHSTAVRANQLNDLTVNTRESKSDAPVCNLSISFTKQCPNP
jgi:hypothetical protein